MPALAHDLLKRPEGRVLVLRFKFTARVSPEELSGLKVRIAELLNKTQPNAVVIDLRKTTSWNSQVFGLFLSIHKRAIQHGGHVAASGLSDHLATTYRLCGLDRIIPAFKSVEDALAAPPSH